MTGAMQHYRSRWLRYGGLCVLSVLVFVGASMMHQRALTAAVDEEVHRAVVFAEDTMASLVKDVNLREPLPEQIRSQLTAKLDRDFLTGSTVVRIRLFADDASLIYSTDDGDRLGTRSAGDVAATKAAFGGRPTGFEDLDRVSLHGDTQSLRLLSTYVPLSVKGGKTDAVLEVDQRFRPIEAETSQPWRALQLLGLAGAVVFLELCLLWLARHISAARLASRSGFQPMAGTPEREPSAKDLRAEEKQAQARAALEQQLETLRAQVAGQDEAAAAMRASFEERLRDADQRAARAEGAGDVGALHAAKDRAAMAEQKLGQAEARLQEAEARVAELVAEVRMLQDRPAAEPSADPQELATLRERVEEQTRRAAEEEQRARDALQALREHEQASASVDAARAELDAKLAREMAEHQATRSRAEALETDLAAALARVEEAADLAREGARRVDEATAAGDATREEVTRISAERDELARRIASLESTVADSVHTAEELAAELEHERTRMRNLETEKGEVDAELVAVKAARDVAEQSVGDAEARAKAAESRLAATASDLSTEAATLAAELDAERERLRAAEERALAAERRGDEMDKHASSLAQALEDERVHREAARAEVTEARAEVATVRAELESEQAATASLRAELESERSAVTTLRAELESERSAVTTLRAELESERTGASSSVEEMRRLIDEAESALAQTTQARATADGEVASLREQLSAAVAGAEETAAAGMQAQQQVQELQGRIDELERAATEAEAERAAAGDQRNVRSEELQTENVALRGELSERDARITELEGGMAALEASVAALEQGNADLRTRAAEAEAATGATIADLETRLAAAPSAGSGPDGGTRELERENETLREELESMGMRLRRAYADAEDARAQLQAMPTGAMSLVGVGGPASADGLDEIQKLRLELGRAMERAAAAEERAGRLLAERDAARGPGTEAVDGDAGGPEGEEERSLRFRLAKSAARKKGIDGGSGQGGGGSMWS